jgi:ribosomal protein S18 acetylase RimI-like enzyme
MAKVVQTVLVREMGERDREPVIDLIWALNRFENTLIGDRSEERADAVRSLDRDERTIAESTGGVLLIAEKSGCVIGFLAMSIESGAPFIRPELRRHGFVMELVVHEAHRGEGVGTSLLEEAERRVRDAGCRSMLIGVLEANQGAQIAYRKAGFAPYSREMIKMFDDDLVQEQ